MISSQLYSSLYRPVDWPGWGSDSMPIMSSWLWARSAAWVKSPERRVLLMEVERICSMTPNSTAKIANAAMTSIRVKPACACVLPRIGSRGRRPGLAHEVPAPARRRFGMDAGQLPGFLPGRLPGQLVGIGAKDHLGSLDDGLAARVTQPGDDLAYLVAQLCAAHRTRNGSADQAEQPDHQHHEFDQAEA